MAESPVAHLRAFDRCLQILCRVCSFAVGEVWTLKADKSGFELVAFHSPENLVVRRKVVGLFHLRPPPLHPFLQDDAGEEVVHNVDLELARGFSSQHKLAHRMCSDVAESKALDWCYDLVGDDLLESLKFKLNTAVAVPVLNIDSSVAHVMIFFSARLEQASPALVTVLHQSAGSLNSLMSYQATFQAPPVVPEFKYVFPPPVQTASAAKSPPSLDAWLKLACDGLDAVVGEVWFMQAGTFQVGALLHRPVAADIPELEPLAVCSHGPSPRVMCPTVASRRDHVWLEGPNIQQDAPHLSVFGALTQAVGFPVQFSAGDMSGPPAVVAAMVIYWKDTNARRPTAAGNFLRHLAAAANVVCESLSPTTSGAAAGGGDDAPAAAAPSSAAAATTPLPPPLSYGVGASTSAPLDLLATASSEDTAKAAKRQKTGRTSRAGVKQTRGEAVVAAATNAPLRRGKWSNEEETYTQEVVRCFKEGTLPIPDGTTLRSLLAVQLHCGPMRITKKFSKDHSIGKQIFHKANVGPTELGAMTKAAMDRLQAMRNSFVQLVQERDGIKLDPDAAAVIAAGAKPGLGKGFKPDRKRPRPPRATVDDDDNVYDDEAGAGAGRRASRGRVPQGTPPLPEATGAPYPYVPAGGAVAVGAPAPNATPSGWQGMPPVPSVPSMGALSSLIGADGAPLPSPISHMVAYTSAPPAPGVAPPAATAASPPAFVAAPAGTTAAPAPAPAATVAITPAPSTAAVPAPPAPAPASTSI